MDTRMDGSEGETAGSFDKTYLIQGYLIQDIFGEVDSMHNFPEELMSKLRLEGQWDLIWESLGTGKDVVDGDHSLGWKVWCCVLGFQLWAVPYQGMEGPRGWGGVAAVNSGQILNAQWTLDA